MSDSSSVVDWIWWEVSDLRVQYTEIEHWIVRCLSNIIICSPLQPKPNQTKPHQIETIPMHTDGAIHRPHSTHTHKHTHIRDGEYEMKRWARRWTIAIWTCMHSAIKRKYREHNVAGVCMFWLHLPHLFGTVALVQLKTVFRSHLLCNGIDNAHVLFPFFCVFLLKIDVATSKFDDNNICWFWLDLRSDLEIYFSVRCG